MSQANEQLSSSIKDEKLFFEQEVAKEYALNNPKSKKNQDLFSILADPKNKKRTARVIWNDNEKGVFKGVAYIKRDGFIYFHYDGEVGEQIMDKNLELEKIEGGYFEFKYPDEDFRIF